MSPLHGISQLPSVLKCTLRICLASFPPNLWWKSCGRKADRGEFELENGRDWEGTPPLALFSIYTFFLPKKVTFNMHKLIMRIIFPRVLPH